MKLQIDTTNKTVKVEENVKVADLIRVLKSMLPNEWERFTLETHTEIIGWREPIYIKTAPYIEPYKYPWYYSNGSDSSGEIMMNTNKVTAEYSLKPGLYNVEAQ